MALSLSNFKFPKGARKKIKRLGRGQSSGLGKTSGRGQKGQNSRSGGGTRPGFEGGQMPLIRRLPKRGFTNIFRVEYAPVNLESLKDAEAGARIDVAWLKTSGLVRSSAERVKVLGDGEAPKGITVCAHKFSKSARSKLEEAGSTAEVIES